MQTAVSDLRCEGFCTLHVLAQLQEIMVETTELNDQHAPLNTRSPCLQVGAHACAAILSRCSIHAHDFEQCL